LLKRCGRLLVQRCCYVDYGNRWTGDVVVSWRFYIAEKRFLQNTCLCYAVTFAPCTPRRILRSLRCYTTLDVDYGGLLFTVGYVDCALFVIDWFVVAFAFGWLIEPALDCVTRITFTVDWTLVVGWRYPLERVGYLRRALAFCYAYAFAIC